MANGTKKIDDLAELLERTGGDAQRLEVVRRTQRFKRSWIELAEALIKVRAGRAYERWGYDDFHAYCAQELTLKKATVDKLTVSYSTVQRHAPEVLEWDGVARTIPTVEAIDYFSRAIGDGPANDLSGDEEPAPASSRRAPPRPHAPEVLDELKSAVFDEGQPVAELRKRFDPVLHPRPKGAEKLDMLNKASAAARKLAELLPDLDGLPEKRVRRLEEELGALRDDIEALAEPLREKLARASKKTTPPRLPAAQGG
ncbi:hypothetical protein [Nannocystis radixulma]|uniref:DUF3102 domain-containing protein n=1 Tax=Nannocystis radixulma TaxID=2995305 RepID=A0ABT5B5Y3_9BACT|nr:hypothetical protein [Nannocystis radixulma]MDC0669123.1 hypothetical protein [Nannocystis radixulma]